MTHTGGNKEFYLLVLISLINMIVELHPSSLHGSIGFKSKFAFRPTLRKSQKLCDDPVSEVNRYLSRLCHLVEVETLRYPTPLTSNK